MKKMGFVFLIAASIGCTGDVVSTDEVPDLQSSPDDGMDLSVSDFAEVNQSDAESDSNPVHDLAEDMPVEPSRCVLIEHPSPKWFVSPVGSDAGAGTKENPLSLARALSAEGPVQPGDRVELAGGTYAGHFISRVAGAAGSHIIFAPEPGQRVTLDSNVSGDAEDGFIIQGRWVEFHGLEIMHSGTNRAEKPGGVGFYAPNSKLVNSVVHNTMQGISFWTPAVDSELYGNIIFNNGYEGPSRGHGHAIYTQNATGTKRLANNIIFFGFGYGIHAYTEGGSIQGFDIVDNVWFRTGASRPGASQSGTSDGCLVGGLQPVARTRLIGNQSWAPSVNARSTLVGWGGQVQNEDITFEGNYLVGRVGAQGSWQTGTLENNVFHSELSGIDPADYPNNVYSSALPSGVRVVVRGNDHDPGRLDIVVYNWESQDSVLVDLSGVLPEGAPYQIFSVFDLWGAAVESGVYEGGSVSIAMGARQGPQPLGAPDAISGADDPGKMFGVFVLRTACSLH